MSMMADGEQLVKRYETLKRLYFSHLSDPQYDEDGEEVPSAYPTKAQIVEIFMKQMGVHVPRSPTDPISFLR